MPRRAVGASPARHSRVKPPIPAPEVAARAACGSLDASSVSCLVPTACWRLRDRVGTFYEAAVSSQLQFDDALWKCGNPFCGFSHFHTRPSFEPRMRVDTGRSPKPGGLLFAFLGDHHDHHAACHSHRAGGAISITIIRAIEAPAALSPPISWLRHLGRALRRGQLRQIKRRTVPP